MPITNKGDNEMLLNALNDRDLDWFFRSPTMSDKIARYPLTNLAVEGERLLIEVAIAGFSKDNIEIELKGNQLHISGNKEDSGKDGDVKYIQRNISSTPFKRIIMLHDNYVSGKIDAEVQDGILTIHVEPVEQSRKLISIN
jgi:molecular chaperone IbpA